MSELDGEDRDVLRAWGAAGLLGPDEAEEVTLPGDESSEARVRLHLETVGLLPYALEAPAPPMALRTRLLAAVAGEETMAVSGQARRTPSGARPAANPRPQAPPAIVARRSRWPMAMAATLAIACLGLAGWLFMQLEEQRGEAARLQARMRQLGERQAELEAMRSQLTSLRQNVGMMTAPGVLACALRPAAPAAAVPAARGVLFVAADHQHWYLAVHGLTPAPAGQAYQLWWEADLGMVSGGTFDAVPGAPVELSSETMPRGTRAVLVTLEPKSGSVVPRGPQVLAGNEMLQLL